MVSSASVPNIKRLDVLVRLEDFIKIYP